MLRLALIFGIVCAMSACANVTQLRHLQPGVSTETDASRLAHRQPGHVWNNSDGTRTLEYSNEPYDGFDCFMVTVDAKGAVINVEQVITDANTGRVQKGMTQEQVQRLLGEPRSAQHFPLSGEDVWDWNVDADIDAIIRFNAHFIDGKLVRTSTRRVDVSDCGLSFCN